MHKKIKDFSSKKLEDKAHRPWLWLHPARTVQADGAPTHARFTLTPTTPLKPSLKEFNKSKKEQVIKPHKWLLILLRGTKSRYGKELVVAITSNNSLLEVRLVEVDFF